MANMSQGCLVLVDRGITDLDKLGFREQFHYLAYGDHGEMVENVKRARDERFRKTIVMQAKEAVKAHSWRARAQELIRVVGG